jgi:3-dehydroquinate synthase
VVTVSLLSYRIAIDAGALDRIGDLVREAAKAHRYAIITDDNVGALYADRVRASLGERESSIYSMAAGEAAKTRDSWARLTDAMLADQFGRDTTVIALGGGVVGDVAGFVAATFMRGVPVVQVPTSLLAMIDASIGGKTGVDTDAGKNLVGAFHQPALVLADPDVLRTLPAAHRRAGLAEAIKHGVIADAAYLDRVAEIAPALSADAAPSLDLTPLVAGSVRIKAAVVAADEREHGMRKILNFGHTLGHAVEAESGYGMLHGDAIAVGMVLEARLGERLGITAAGTADRIATIARAAGLPVGLPPTMDVAAVLARTRADKKARAGVVEYALPTRVGLMAGGGKGGTWSVAVKDDDVRAVLTTG